MIEKGKDTAELFRFVITLDSRPKRTRDPFMYWFFYLKRPKVRSIFTPKMVSQGHYRVLQRMRRQVDLLAFLGQQR